MQVPQWIIFVKDPYDIEMSIKDSEHQRRQEADTSAYEHGSKNVFIQQHEKLPSSLEMNKFFTNSRKKIRLQEFLTGQFLFHAQQRPDIHFIYSVQRTCFNLSRNSNCSRLPEFECLHTEADTILLFLYAQLRRSGRQELVVIDAEDTDVVVLTAHVAHKIAGDLAIMRKRQLFDCRAMCSKEIADIIVQLHVHTGADSVSVFYGQGKKKKKSIFKRVQKAATEARQLPLSVGTAVPVSGQTLQNLTTFTIKFVYDDNVSAKLSETRALNGKK
jgi:hypothetical protein